MKILFVFETKAQQKVRENYRLSVRQRTCVLLKKKHAKLTQNKSTTKGPGELPTECETSARGGRADEATGCQERGRP